MLFQVVVGTLHRSSTTRTPLSPHVIARYIKVLPKHWTKNGYACTKFEVLGCAAGAGEMSLLRMRV